MTPETPTKHGAPGETWRGERRGARWSAPRASLLGVLMAAAALAFGALANRGAWAQPPSQAQPPGRASQTPATLAPTTLTPAALAARDASAALAADGGAAESQAAADDDLGFLLEGPRSWTGPRGLSSSLQIMLLLTVLSLAPAILLMTTSFVRIVVVLGLLRQALGLQQSPPNQIITSLALFLTLLIMTPVWNEVYHEAIAPYSRSQSPLTWEEAFQAGVKPIRRFMSMQIEAAGNSDDVWLFYDRLPQTGPPPATYDDVPLQVLLPAYLLSELKIAFLIGFQLYLPFLILDIVVASFTMSMGMVMLPPSLISLPFKLLLFVLVDGWTLVVGMLLESFAAPS